MLCADADGVNAQANLLRQLCCFERLHFACGVGAVREQDEYLLAPIYFLVVNAFYSERYRIANGCLLARKTNECLEQQNLNRLPVQRQRHLQVGTLTEQNQADAIAFTTTDEIAGDCLCRRQPIHSPIAEFEVLLIHAPRQINREHQVAAGYRYVQFVAYTLRPRCREHQQNPGDSCQPEAPVQQLFGFRAMAQH